MFSPRGFQLPTFHAYFVFTGTSLLWRDVACLSLSVWAACLTWSLSLHFLNLLLICSAVSSSAVEYCFYSSTTFFSILRLNGTDWHADFWVKRVSTERRTYRRQADIYTSHKKFLHVGMETSKTNQTRREWHHNTFTPSLHLVPFCHHLHKYALCLLVVCREGLWKAVGWVVVGV